MQLESLANELLLDLFEYFNAIHLFHTFHSLNSRFDKLLLEHFHVYNVDFQSVSKRDFDIFCRKHLSSIIKQVVSLRLSNDTETPDLPNHFLNYRFTISQFIHLKFLRLNAIDPINLVLKILLSCRSLVCLTHLKITGCSSSYCKNINNLINNIWRLPKLTHCHLDTNFSYLPNLIWSTLISSQTIEYLFVKYIPFSGKDLAELLARTPNLRHLAAKQIDDRMLLQPFTVAPSIIRLNMSTNYSLDLLEKFLKMMPNLSHVTLKITNKSDLTYLSGHQWERLIVDNLCNIKVFRFSVRYTFVDKINIGERIDNILDTFRTSFWLEEHHWFVRCDWITQFERTTISLYTLPYCFGDVDTLHPTMRSKSTYPVGQNNWLNNDASYAPLSCIFPKINHLKIELPIDGSFWSLTTAFDHLTSLEVSLNNKTGLYQLQTLINGAPRLYSLSVKRLSVSQLTQLNIIHTRLRRLSLEENCYNASECSLFASSPLGRQCEVLSIVVTDRRNVPGLISEMPNLRALVCFCDDHKWDLDESLKLETMNVVEWLQKRLPSKCSISRGMTPGIQIWIG